MKPPLGTQLDFANPLNRGLVMHLAMNEGHGDRVYDLSMNGNHGKLEGFAFPPTLESGWNPGSDGIGLNFDGSDDYIDCGDDPSLDITDVITIEMVVKVRDTGGYLLSKNFASAADSQYGVYIAPTGPTYYPTSVLVAGTGLYDGEWHHFVLTRNSTHDGQFYLDGVPDGDSVPINMPSRPDYHLRPGCRWQSTDPYLHGDIDIGTMRILNRAYTAEEVLERYMNPNGVYLDEDD